MTPLRPSQWEAWIRPGSRVFVGGGSACPRSLIASLLEHASALKEIEMTHGLVVGECPWMAAGLADTFTVNLLCADTDGESGQIDSTPGFASEVPGLFLDGILPLDVALVQVTPPDAHGYCSLGTGVDLASAACRAARTVIAQINPRLSRTHGQSFIHRDRIDAVFEQEEALLEHPVAEPAPEAETIGKYVAQLVPDGATIHFGFGAMTHPLLRALQGHKDLGLHTEILTDSHLPLLESGACNNRRKSIHPGKTVAASCIGTRRLYDFVHDNPHVELHPTEYVDNPAVIASHCSMVAAHGAVELDLSGRVTPEGPGPGFRGSTGSHADFFRGATMSTRGVSIVALSSATLDGGRSRIVPELSGGGGGVTLQGMVHYVVTEYGIATLRGRSVRERALELIQVAHPRFRDDLLREAVSRRWVPSYHRSSPRPVADLGETEVRKLDLKGEPFILRPLHPSDIRRLQEFFYSHTIETIRMRYGYTVTRMTRERAYDLVNVDQAKDLALAIFEVQGPRQIIHAVGRYYLDDDRRGAEVAFVVRESKRRLGMASTLLDALAAVARRRGLEFLWGRVRNDNLPMLALFRRYGGQPMPSTDAGTTEQDIKLPLSGEWPERAKRKTTPKPRPSTRPRPTGRKVRQH